MTLAQGPEEVTFALNVASQFTFWVGFAFPIVISFVWPWWRTVWGMNLVTLEVWIWLSLLPAPLHAYFGVPYHPLLWFQVCAVVGAGVTILWRGILIYLTQRAARRLSPQQNWSS